MRPPYSWDEVWMSVAQDISLRSSCEKGRCGAVVVTADNRIVATGYNGAPSGWSGKCGTDCPRAIAFVADQPLSPCYDDCVTVHAEANALLFCDRRDREGGTIYVTSTICFACAKLIANSGLHRVVMGSASFVERDGARSVSFLLECGLMAETVGQR